MKKLTLIIILAVLISLAVVTPVLAKGGGPYKQPCYMQWHPRMYGFGVRNFHADGAGNPWGPWFGISQACYATPPKIPYWLH